MSNHRNILNNGFMVGEKLAYTEADRICVPVPFYHCFGMVMGNLGCTSHGATMVIPADAFDATAVLEAVRSRDPEAARKAMVRHMRLAERSLAKGLAVRGEP